MSEVSRRQILTVGALGAAGLAAAQSARANTQNPPEPQASVNPDGCFAGKVVLITGATSGIGEATARAFAAEGAAVHFAIAPGAVDTPMLRRALEAWNTDFETVSQEYPIRRIVMPEEIARSVMFLCSDQASCITGMDLDATGGYLTK